MRRDHSTTLFIGLGCAALLAACARSDTGSEAIGTADQAIHNGHHKYGLGYNAHLEDTIRFEPIQAGSDANHGRELFGAAPDLVTPDSSNAFFGGFSLAAQKVIVPNGRTCFSCHRGANHDWGLPPPPLSDSIATTDPLLAQFNADAQGDPRAQDILENHALIKYRPNRFNDARPESDAFRQVFFWRKTPHLVNIGLAHGFLNDGRGRTNREATQGAVFAHTQSGDDRFDDLFEPQNQPPAKNSEDMTAFQFGLVTDPVLLALRDPNDPMFQTLVDHPFYTVPVKTAAQRRGQHVFEQYCFTCHDVPNVFNNRANVEALGADGLDPQYPTHAPSVGRTFDIGVAEANMNNLSYTRYVGPGQYEPIVLQLAKEDGSIVNYEVDMDVGLAATTARYVDVGRFKVPQLRDLKKLAPYFHDNSVATLAGVVDYFDSDAYNDSPDGRRFPIHLNPQQKQDLLAFLNIL